MPILILILLILLVAQIGFWKTFASVLGAIGVIVLLVLVAGLLVTVTAGYLLGRFRRGP